MYNKCGLKKIKKIGMLIVATVFVSISYGQSSHIIENLKKPDSATGATVSVYQDLMITDIVTKKISGYQPMPNLSKGWSVQVFSDNSITAKDEAFKIENKIKDRMPYEYVRAERHAPFWKVRVGQFQTSEDAQELRDLLIKEFPELKGGIYIVRFNSN